jgi:hypothetical protein
MKRNLLAAALLFLSAATAHADNFTWEATGKPLDICYAVQKNVKFFYNTWATGAKDTYLEMKDYMHKTLDSKGPREAKLLAVYEGVLPKIENGELLPPQVETRYVGNNKAQQIAGAACFSAFDAK